MTDIEKDNWCELHSEFHGNCLEELAEARKEQPQKESAGEGIIRRFMAEESKTHEEEEPKKGTTVKFRRYAPLLAAEQPPVNKLIHEAFRTLTHAVHTNAVEHGWFDTEMPNKEMEFLVGMAGVMKECGEALEVVSAKEWDVKDEKCPQHTKLSIELADIVLRLLTLCGKHNINIGAAITAKHEFNRSRPYRHGGKAF